jgi:hypothetical protein
LSGLENLLSLNGELYIKENPLLANLGGLNNLESIAGFLNISGNSSLTGLSELSNLTTIGGDLTISYNSMLTSLSGIHQIEAVSITGLTIYHNLALTTCAVKSICAYLELPNGSILIQQNGPDCANADEVMAICDTIGIDENNANIRLSVYPNPFNNLLSIDYFLTEACIISLTIINPLGQETAVLQNDPQISGDHHFRWDSGNLPAGIYNCRITTGRSVVSMKIVKLK